MEKINNVLEKTYSFKGTHLLLGGLLILSLMILFSCMGGRHGGHRGMQDHEMRGGDRQHMMQQYDRQTNGGQRQGMRGQAYDQNMNQGQADAMINGDQAQSIPSVESTGTGN